MSVIKNIVPVLFEYAKKRCAEQAETQPFTYFFQ